jgi:ABC-2 type transport system ATP-binding protein
LGEAILQLNNITKSYGNLKAVDQISYSVREREIVGLVGPNGAGKTTTLKLIARLTRPYSGTICIRNIEGKLQDIYQNSTGLVEMGFLIDIPQFYNTNPWCLLRYIMNIRNCPKAEIEPRIDRLLKEFELYRWKYKNIKTFSKGMAQKLGFIMSIIHEPELIILDEPQTGLDPESRMKIRKCLKSLQDAGKSILISSHLLSEIRELCDRIAIINKGRLVGFDSIDNLERRFKIKQLICEIDEKIAPEKINDLLAEITRSLKPHFINTASESEILKKVLYNPETPSLEISYEGVRESRSKILEILSTNFKADFTISAFYEPKISQIEKLYSQTVTQNNKEG